MRRHGGHVRPADVGRGCWYMWHVGRDRMLRMKRISKEAAAAATSGVAAGSASLLTVPVAHAAQLRFVVTHFDEGGALSLNWKKTTDSLGEPPDQNMDAVLPCGRATCIRRLPHCCHAMPLVRCMLGSLRVRCRPRCRTEKCEKAASEVARLGV